MAVPLDRSPTAKPLTSGFRRHGSRLDTRPRPPRRTRKRAVVATHWPRLREHVPFLPLASEPPALCRDQNPMFSWKGERPQKGSWRKLGGAGQDDTPLRSATGIPALRCERGPHVLGHPGRLPDSDSGLLPSETRNGMTPCRKPHAVCTHRRDFLTASAPRRLTNRENATEGRTPVRNLVVCVHTGRAIWHQEGREG